jgi:hypothetical protein
MLNSPQFSWVPPCYIGMVLEQTHGHVQPRKIGTVFDVFARNPSWWWSFGKRELISQMATCGFEPVAEDCLDSALDDLLARARDPLLLGFNGCFERSSFQPAKLPDVLALDAAYFYMVWDFFHQGGMGFALRAHTPPDLKDLVFGTRNEFPGPRVLKMRECCDGLSVFFSRFQPLHAEWLGRFKRWSPLFDFEKTDPQAPWRQQNRIIIVLGKEADAVTGNAIARSDIKTITRIGDVVHLLTCEPDKYATPIRFVLICCEGNGSKVEADLLGQKRIFFGLGPDISGVVQFAPCAHFTGWPAWANGAGVSEAVMRHHCLAPGQSFASSPNRRSDGTIKSFQIVGSPAHPNSLR